MTSIVLGDEAWKLRSPIKLKYYYLTDERR